MFEGVWQQGNVSRVHRAISAVHGFLQIKGDSHLDPPVFSEAHSQLDASKIDIGEVAVPKYL